jgi:hypothetical protein
VDEDRRSVEDGGSDALSGSDRDAQQSGVSQSEPLPITLRQRLDRCAEQWLHERETGQPNSAVGATAGFSGAAPTARRSTIPWYLAAAFLFLAVAGWWPRLMSLDSSAASATAVGQWRANVAREQMLASSPRVGHWPWAGDARGAAGDVVWDNARQRGFLRLKGFVANDPASARYQLWIFDAARDDRYPVDGGMFDVPPGREEVVIPVRPSVPVLRPAAFAVTVEGPGGAVVSEREKVVAFARSDR